MDIEAIKVLLDSQAKTFHTAMDFVAEQFKSRIRDAEVTIQDLTRSLEFSQAEVKELQTEVKDLKKSANESKTGIETLKEQIKDLQQRQNYQEDYNRRNNLRISGIEEKPGESWEDTAVSVSKLIKEKLQLPDVKLERAHRTGPALSSRSRVIIARFEKFSEREAVIRNAKKLKGSNMYIDEDLCPASLEIRKSQVPLMKKAREEGKIAFFRHTKLIIKNRSNNYQSLGTRMNEATSGGSSAAGDGVSTHGPVRDVSGAVVRTAEADADTPLVEAETASSGRPGSALAGSSEVGDGDGGTLSSVVKRRAAVLLPVCSADGRSSPGHRTPADVGGGGSPAAASAQRQQLSVRAKGRRR